MISPDSEWVVGDKATALQRLSTVYLAIVCEQCLILGELPLLCLSNRAVKEAALVYRRVLAAKSVCCYKPRNGGCKITYKSAKELYCIHVHHLVLPLVKLALVIVMNRKGGCYVASE